MAYDSLGVELPKQKKGEKHAIPLGLFEMYFEILGQADIPITYPGIYAGLEKPHTNGL